MRTFKMFNSLSLTVVFLLALPVGYAQSFDLTGLWQNYNGGAIYRVRQIGNAVYWSVDGIPMGSYANIFFGEISGNTITGTWVDLPGSQSLGGGNLTLQIQSNDYFIKIGESNLYGAQEWIRQGTTGGTPTGGTGTGCSSNTYTLTASPSTAHPGETIIVSFTYPGESLTRRDWVGLFQVGGSSYIGTWFHVINEPDCQFSFTAPSTPGQYEYRFLLNDTYDQLVAVTGLTVVAP